MPAVDWTAWTCRVRVAVTDRAALDEARAVAADNLDAVDRAASRFRADSELAALDSSSGRWTSISPLLTELLSVALRAARLTDGDVDPTIGGSMDAAGYQAGSAHVSVEDPLLPASAPGWQTVDLDERRRLVRLAPGVRLDLGATAKAWTADRAAAQIADRTGAGCLVSIGGDVATAGTPPPGGWRIRIEDITGQPDAAPVGRSSWVTLGEGGLATSSIAARRWTRDALQLHHLLDPFTGLPPVPVWRTVSAAARTCVDANIVTTATVVRGQRAWPWLHRLQLPVRLVHVDGDVLTIGGWPEESTYPSRAATGAAEMGAPASPVVQEVA